MNKFPAPILTGDSHRGIYLGRHVIEAVKFEEGSVRERDLDIISRGPSTNSDYFEAWEDVISNGIVVDDDGIRYFLCEDEDIWLVPCGMEWDDAMGRWYWPTIDLSKALELNKGHS